MTTVLVNLKQANGEGVEIQEASSQGEHNIGLVETRIECNCVVNELVRDSIHSSCDTGHRCEEEATEN